MLSMAVVSLFLPFLPLLPKQILLINFLSDIPAMAIATDRVDAEQLARPRRWDIRFIRNFMVLFGLVSSTFDFLTFGTLLFILHAGEEVFRTGWFLVSVPTELAILLVIRTRRRFYRSLPSRQLLVAALAVALATIALPFTPLATILGFATLDWRSALALSGIVGLYVLVSEVSKRFVFRHLR